MTTQLTNEQINAQLEAERAVIAGYETLIAKRRNRIAELEAQRPQELYVVISTENGNASRICPLEEAKEVWRAWNGSGPRFTLHKLIPCNDDGSVRS